MNDRIKAACMQSRVLIIILFGCSLPSWVQFSECVGECLCWFKYSSVFQLAPFNHNRAICHPTPATLCKVPTLNVDE